MSSDIKGEWQKFIELLDGMFKAPAQNSRSIIVLLGVYGEYIVNTLLGYRCTTGLEEINSQDIKLKILFELGEISESEYDVFSKLNAIRNKYAHKLELSQKDIESVTNSMRNITINWDDKNTNPEELEEIMKKNPFLKFQLACISKIGYFLTKIGRKKGEKINQTIILDVRIDGKDEKFMIL